jgi:hypothetical protein
MSIAILAFVAGHYGWVNTYMGCNGNFKGIMEVWKGIDTYLQKVDQNFCSPRCPCFITNTQSFTKNDTIVEYYNQWTKSNIPPVSIAFQNCTNSAQENTYYQTLADDSTFDPTGVFDQKQFSSYMSAVEMEFECSGWCNVTYVNRNTDKMMVMHKYLFSDINRGVPPKLGCLDSMLGYLPAYLNGWGALAVVIALLQVRIYFIIRLLCL